MGREKESFRDNLELILEYAKNKLNDRRMWSVKDVIEYTGLNYRTVKKKFTFDKFNKISVAVLAREMS